MKNEDKFFTLIERIENELKKLESLNNNLSKVDDYVKEVSSIKNHLLNAIKDLLNNFDSYAKNLPKVENYLKEISSINDDTFKTLKNLFNELKSYQKNNDSKLETIQKTFVSEILTDVKALRKKASLFIWILFINIIINLITVVLLFVL